ncbi:MAG TPA: DUF3618 domain-containing protein [Solirubrobacteraceae bacterium]|jgi:hypothetical protein|nr:DUF3618 domain-containing protein [Solirubrobacteraceae bacterium]
MASRTPDEIRASIEENRQQLAVSLGRLREEVVELADWRKQLIAHQEQVLIGAGLAGFVLGGGIAAVGSLLFGGGRRRRRKRASLTNAAIAGAAGSIANVADSIAASATE